MRYHHPLSAALLLALSLACASTRSVAPPGRGYSERGLASWYGPGFHGRPTASGEIYDMHEHTAAHRHLPFGTLVEVRNRENGKRIRVRINDRGPFIRGRIIDLSYAAADSLDLVGPGVARVEIRIVGGVAHDASYLVQVGAFADRDNARALRGELERQFPDVKLRSQGPWHRVLLGPYEKKGKAEKVRRKLARRGYPSVIRRVEGTGS